MEETALWGLHDLCSAPNVIWMRWTWNVAYMGRKEMHTQLWWGNVKEREHWEDLGRNDSHIKLHLQIIGFDTYSCFAHFQITLTFSVYEGTATNEHCCHPTTLHSNNFEIYFQSGDDDRMRWTADILVYFDLFQLTDFNIGNSRDTTFKRLIMSETNGRGVDLVLNSLAEDKLQASVRCLAPGGRFLEIGRFDLDNNSRLGRLYLINLFH